MERRSFLKLVIGAATSLLTFSTRPAEAKEPDGELKAGDIADPVPNQPIELHGMNRDDHLGIWVTENRKVYKIYLGRAGDLEDREKPLEVPEDLSTLPESYNLDIPFECRIQPTEGRHIVAVVRCAPGSPYDYSYRSN